MNKTGFKGFDKNFKCRNFQFAVGKTYEHEGEIKLCRSGFHFCEYPFDIFNYYSPSESRFASVKGEDVSGEDVSSNDDDSKAVCKKILISEEISLTKLIEENVKFILNKVDFNSAATKGNYSAATNGYKSAATNTGYKSAATNTGENSAATNTGYKSAATNTGNYSAATNTGEKSAATNTGNYSAAIVEGKESVAISIGENGKAKGNLWCWLVLSEWKNNHIINVKSAQVDGEKIKPNIFYLLVNNEFVAAK